MKLISLRIVRLAVKPSPQGFLVCALTSPCAPVLDHDGSVIHGTCTLFSIDPGYYAGIDKTLDNAIKTRAGTLTPSQESDAL